MTSYDYVWGSPEFMIWLNNGVANGWISPPICAVHDFVPVTDEEEESIDANLLDSDEPEEDLCVWAVRVVDTQEKLSLLKLDTPTWDNYRLDNSAGWVPTCHGLERRDE